MKPVDERRPWRVVATIGPSSESPETLRRLVRSGVDVARLNFSHGTPESHRRVAVQLREIAAEEQRPVAILQDLQGHKIRVGRVVQGDAMPLEPGQTIRVGYGEHVEPGRIGLDYPEPARSAEPGHDIYLDDGTLKLLVEKIDGDDLVCRVRVGGELRSRKGVIFPHSDLKFPLIEAHDLEDARFGVELGVDILAMSFVRSAREIVEMRSRLNEWGNETPSIVAKIEDRNGINNLDEIFDEADGILVARGDLGVTLPREHVPGVQKDIIRRANVRGVAVITATQMLESMVYVEQPTRAEVNDVYNAIVDGTDAVMLSGETATGKYPVEAVEEMHRICAAAAEDYVPEARVAPPPGFHHPVARAAADMAASIGARAIITFTLGGRSARALSATRTTVPIHAIVADERIGRQLRLHWGLDVTALPLNDNLRELVSAAQRKLCRAGVCAPGDYVVIVAGTKQTSGADSPLVRIHRVE